MTKEHLRLTTRLSAVICVEPISPGTPFPIDMLRFERAVPFQEKDAEAIETTFDRKLATIADYSPRIWLECFWLEHTSLPTPYLERWIGFGWRVVEVR